MEGNRKLNRYVTNANKIVSLNQVEEFFSTGREMLGRELIDKNHTKFAKFKGLTLIQLLEYRQEPNTVKLDDFTHAKVSKYNRVNKFQDMVTGVLTTLIAKLSTRPLKYNTVKVEVIKSLVEKL